MNFAKTLAVVTGGASGIGRACVEFFAARGGRVVVVDRNQEAARAVATAVGGYAYVLDVADELEVKRAEAELFAIHGAPGILVNSAGVLQRTLPPEQLSLKEWDLVQRIDLRGTYLCCAAFGARMAEHAGGAIVNIASVAGMRSGPLHSYGPAKAAVISLTECLAGEWGRRGVRVNAVSPGFTRTPALDKGVANAVMNEHAMSESSALGRLVRAEEVAAAVGFLASDLASAITGVNLPVDVGYLVGAPWSSYGGVRGGRQ